MNFFSSVDRPIFLSFLNREALNASYATRNQATDIYAVQCLAICHCCGMTANLSQLFEYAYEKPKLKSLLVWLIKNGMLESTSHSTDLGEFVSSRQKIYEKVQEAYPMYFENHSELERFPIIKRNVFSMTKLLKRDVFDFEATKLPLLGKHVIKEDVQRLGEGIDQIRRVILDNPEVAVTRGNIEKLASPGSLAKPNLDAAARFFSARYFDHYKSNNGVVIPTGVGLTGFLDDLDHFPSYDIPILQKTLLALGWTSLTKAVPDISEEMCVLYGGALHQRFVMTLNAFLALTYRVVLRTANIDPASHDSVSSLRRMTIRYTSYLIAQSFESKGRQHSSLMDFFENSIAAIRLATKIEAGKNSSFAEYSAEQGGQMKAIKILFLTATDAEDDALVKALRARHFKFLAHERAGQGIAATYERGTGCQAVHVRSSAGSVGASGSELTAYDAFRTMRPDYTIAVGICFGLKPDKTQKLGDILVSDRVTDYETVRVGEGETRDRGTRTPSGTMLLSASRMLRNQYTEGTPKVFHGEILSGMKLIDSESFSTQLATRYQDAIGGEMEGTGISSSASRLGNNWIIVKAICDWARGKDDSAHELAADNAAEYAVRLAELVFEISFDPLMEE